MHRTSSGNKFPPKDFSFKIADTYLENHQLVDDVPSSGPDKDDIINIRVWQHLDAGLKLLWGTPALESDAAKKGLVNMAYNSFIEQLKSEKAELALKKTEEEREAAKLKLQRTQEDIQTLDKEHKQSLLRKLTDDTLDDKLRQLCNFNVKDFAKAVDNALDSHSVQESGPAASRLILAGGLCQVRKTSFICMTILQAFLNHQKAICIVITYQVSGRRDLVRKIKDTLGKLMSKGNIPVQEAKNLFKRDSKGFGLQMADNIIDVVRGCGALVAHNSPDRITNLKKLFELIKSKPQYANTKLIIIHDEVDVDLSKPVMKDIEDFTSFWRPVLTVNVSATLRPVLHQLEEKGTRCQDVNAFFSQPSEEYVGLHSYRPFQDIRTDLPVYLERPDVHCYHEDGDAPERLSEKRKTAIPHWNENIQNFYSALVDEFTNNEDKWPLLIDICATKVYQEDTGILTRIRNIQALKIDGKQKFADITFLAVTGNGVFVYFGSQILNTQEFPTIDHSAHKRYSLQHEAHCPESGAVYFESGLTMAIDKADSLEAGVIVVMGYGKVERGVSVVGTHRKPTHMICAPGKGATAETLFQMAGRASFFGRDLLEHYCGYQHVTVYMSEIDYKKIKHDAAFQEEVFKRINENNKETQTQSPKTIAEILKEVTDSPEFADSLTLTSPNGKKHKERRSTGSSESVKKKTKKESALET
ncbi:hypothetical protein CYMTET_54169 [Cymbomonas tetramitiformis]|uniref:Uncharacterized protein n=1 Tax=Cymbomonas tetramitiformis TaxID=36881 RepID=A0AAE0EPB8_9CHLO|nr:hypothetical protein CYMTET_54169 [Cymbomonas tetramitiformis]|eukprot:gene9189-10889_t